MDRFNVRPVSALIKINSYATASRTFYDQFATIIVICEIIRLCSDSGRELNSRFGAWAVEVVNRTDFNGFDHKRWTELNLDPTPMRQIMSNYFVNT